MKSNEMRFDSKGTPYVVFTEAQIAALGRKWLQDDQSMSFADFVATAAPTVGCDAAIAVPWCGMVLCIETDGHTHS